TTKALPPGNSYSRNVEAALRSVAKTGFAWSLTSTAFGSCAAAGVPRNEGGAQRSKQQLVDALWQRIAEEQSSGDRCRGSCFVSQLDGGVLFRRVSVRMAKALPPGSYSRNFEAALPSVAKSGAHHSKEQLVNALYDGSVVTWGHARFGGTWEDWTEPAQLRNVSAIQSTNHAFAAIRTDGSVVTWGDSDCDFEGGDISQVRERLKDVREIQSSLGAFAALLRDGSVVTWGWRTSGGDSSTVQHQLTDVDQIACNGHAFAAIKADGTVVSWGHPDRGGDSGAVQNQLKKVRAVAASATGVAAFLDNDAVVTWGNWEPQPVTPM
ncbi:RUG3, partial [Symbiodinium sp. KB8]